MSSHAAGATGLLIALEEVEDFSRVFVACGSYGLKVSPLLQQPHLKRALISARKYERRISAEVRDLAQRGRSNYSY
jgi:hypothetical protein